MARLDSVDVSILENLQKNGRMTNVCLAESVGISAPPCLRRLKLMEKKGVITSYHAVINPDSVGFSIRAVCVVTLASQSPEVVDAFIKLVNECSNIRTCFSSTGNEAFVLSIVARTLREYEKVVKNTLQKSGLVMNITSYINLNKHKDEFGVPVEALLESDSNGK